MTYTPQTLSLRNVRQLKAIKKIVAEYYQVPADIFETHVRSRAGEVIKLRQMVAYVSKLLIPNVSLKAIGISLGGLNHATMLNAIKRLKDLMETEKRIGIEANEIIEMIINSGVEELNDVAKRFRAEYLHIPLNNIKVLKFSKDSAIVFTGVDGSMIEVVRSALMMPNIPLKEFKNTGMSLIQKHDYN